MRKQPSNGVLIVPIGMDGDFGLKHVSGFEFGGSRLIGFYLAKVGY